TRLPQVSRLSVITALIQRRANRWACPRQSRILATFLESPLSDESTVGKIAARARRKDLGINSPGAVEHITIASCADGAIERHEHRQKKPPRCATAGAKRLGGQVFPKRHLRKRIRVWR